MCYRNMQPRTFELWIRGRKATATSATCPRVLIFSLCFRITPDSSVEGLVEILAIRDTQSRCRGRDRDAIDMVVVCDLWNAKRVWLDSTLDMLLFFFSLVGILLVVGQYEWYVSDSLVKEAINLASSQKKARRRSVTCHSLSEFVIFLYPEWCRLGSRSDIRAFSGWNPHRSAPNAIIGHQAMPFDLAVQIEFTILISLSLHRHMYGI